MLRRISQWLRALLRRGVLEREMRAEMAMHLERATEQLVARGIPADEARVAARRDFGNVGWLSEEGRRARGGQWVGALTADIRFAFRQFSRAPLATATMIGVLSLGIGANVALFGVLHSMTRRPAPGIPPDDALIRIQAWSRSRPGRPRDARSLSYAEFQDYAAQRQLFAGVAAWSTSTIALGTGSLDDPATPAVAHYVTGNHFDLLGIRLVIGAGLPRTQPDSLPADLVAVINHRIWEHDFGRAPDVLGRTIRINDVPLTVVGVAPPRFAGVDASTSEQKVWVPLGARRILEGGGGIEHMRADSAALHAFARLTPGVDASQAMPVVRSIAERYPLLRTTSYRPYERSTTVAPLRANNQSPDGDTEAVVGRLVFAGIALLILAITCTTVSSLLVGLAIARRHEVAVRVSLGASRARLVRQFLTESAVLATAAAVVSLALLWLIAQLIQAGLRDIDLAFGWQTITFAFGFAIGTAVLFGLSPALHATRAGVSRALKDSSAAIVSSRSRLQQSLVVAQIALSQPLLLGLVAFIGLVSSERADTGRTSRDRIVVVTFGEPSGGGARGEAPAALRGLRERIARLPDVHAAVMDNGSGITSDYAVHAADRVPDETFHSFRARGSEIPPGYFDVLDIPLARGREFLPDDVRASPAPVIIGSDLAEDLWGSANPIGRRFIRARQGREDERVVIGVFDADRAGRMDERFGQVVFVPLNDAIRGHLVGTLYVRTRTPAEPLIPTLRALARDEAPRVPLRTIETMASRDARARAGNRQLSGMGGAGGVLALLLSAIGLYAVVAFAVAQRTREIGIRLALGARQLQVISIFLRTGFKLSLIGLVIGLPIGFVAVRLLIRLLETELAHLSWLAAGVGILVIAVAALATWFPARRAAMVDPLIALRSE